jgi:SpoVK/Ycf46/Vps4 family AAA+-type ATPase
MGPAGSGKTSSTEVIANFMELSGMLVGGLPFRVDNPGTLMSKFVGGTTGKTMQAFSDSIESVLFIDEAYGMLQGGNRGYGQEAILAAMTQMDKFKGRHVLIFAGYEKEMGILLNDVNEGLSRRFPYKIYLKPLGEDKLFGVFKDVVEKQIPKSELLSERFAELEGFFRDKSHFPNSTGDVMVFAGFFMESWFEEEVLQTYNVSTNPGEFVPKLIGLYKSTYLKKNATDVATTPQQRHRRGNNAATTPQTRQEDT